VRAYRLADNRLAEHAEWDVELLQVELSSIIELGETSVEILGWSTGEVDVLLDNDERDIADYADDIPEPPSRPVARLGDIWRLGRHRLLCGSSLEPGSWEQLMCGERAAMAFTDAPYNVPVQGHVSGLGKARHPEFAMASGEMSAAEFITFNANYLANMEACLADGALVMACMDHRHLFELMAAARQVGLHHLNLCVWKKTNGGMGSLWRSQHKLVLGFVDKG
jgi:hypothetical protein